MHTTTTIAEAPPFDTTSNPGTCFHCGLPVPAGVDIFVTIDGQAQPVCCRGCEAVANAIVNAGHADFYRHRTASAPTGHEIVPEFLRQVVAYDHPEVQRGFVHRESEHVREAALILEGITCPACLWLNERHLASLPGVLSAHINYATHRARVRWDERRVHLSDILKAVSEIGYLAHPYDPDRQQRLLEREKQQRLRRLGVAGVLGMQVMILAVALYAGDWSGMEMEFKTFFHWLSLGLTLPVLLYSGQPFFRSAWNDLSHRRAGMDVPVALGLTVAFSASAWNTVQGAGEVYFDAVVMFIFLLLGARYFELTARQRAADAADSLVHAVPAMATRLITNNSHTTEEVVPVAELQPGDYVRVLPGASVPADAVVVSGRSTVDESLLTGENLPRVKTAGTVLVGGSINIESPLTARVEKTGQDTVLSAILRLLNRAQSEKPALTLSADRIASWFVAGVLVLAAVVAVYWWINDATRWVPITIAVLVVTCPCALSLATPAALTAATSRLTRLGLLPTRGHALETLARATHFIFDKTGTLTHGRPRLQTVQTFSTHSDTACLRYAAGLERQSEHPIARAIVEAAGSTGILPAQAIQNTPGAGIQGVINNERFYLGSEGYIKQHTDLTADAKVMESLRRHGNTVIVLASGDKIHAAFALRDELRPGAHALVQALQASGKTVLLYTGDHEQAARHVARAVGIEHVAWDLTPAQKLARMHALQQSGAVVAMIGDGINDAPVLAGAQVSIAMGGGAQLAAATADMILMSQQLQHVGVGVATARKTLNIIRQNLLWAIGYNAVAIPAAALGFIAPWLAVIGMSASSLIVVANALRLVERNKGTGLFMRPEVKLN